MGLNKRDNSNEAIINHRFYVDCKYAEISLFSLDTANCSFMTDLLEGICHKSHLLAIIWNR